MDKTREALYSLLGDLPGRELNISSRLVAVDEEYNESFILESLVLELNGIEPVPAYFTRPKNAKPPYPTILYSHFHDGNYKLGKDELLTKNVQFTPDTYVFNVSYAEALAKLGIACLAIDHWCFGERSGRSESETFKSMLWRGRVLWGMMVYDSLKALDYLETRNDVDMSRIGTLGRSMGSTMSIWVSALDKRVKTCVDTCCLTDFEELERENNLDGHGIYYYVPSLLKYFSMADINALIAPRPHLSTAGIYDHLTPLTGLKKIEGILKEVYIEKGEPNNFVLKTYPCGHLETREMREDVLHFICETLI